MGRNANAEPDLLPSSYEKTGKSGQHIQSPPYNLLANLDPGLSWHKIMKDVVSIHNFCHSNAGVKRVLISTFQLSYTKDRDFAS